LKRTGTNDSEKSADAAVEAAAWDALTGTTCIAPDDEVRVDPTYRKARRRFDEVANLLPLATPAAVPPPDLKGRLLARLAEKKEEKAASTDAPKEEDFRPQGAFDVAPGVRAVRTEEAGWIKSPFPGIEFKVVHRDGRRGFTTRLVKFVPGAKYPRHRHGGSEEIFLIEGSINVSGTLLKAGDYCRSEAGSDEWGTYTDTGGVALIVSSDLDEVSTEL
jgi:quercetin dioxygenase-like cupin family protein